MTENRKMLSTSDLDGFNKRKLPSPGFQVEVLMLDYDSNLPTKSKANSANKQSASSGGVPTSNAGVTAKSNRSTVSGSEDNDDIFSDSEGKDSGASKSRQGQAASAAGSAKTDQISGATAQNIGNLTHITDHLSLSSQKPAQNIASKEETTTDGAGKAASGIESRRLGSGGVSDIKAIAADASMFSFGDKEDFESDLSIEFHSCL